MIFTANDHHRAVNDACTRESANAIQSVMLVAQDKPDNVIASADAERDRQGRVEETQQKKKAA